MPETGDSLVYGGVPGTGAAYIFPKDWGEASAAMQNRQMRMEQQELRRQGQFEDDANSGLNNLQPWAVDQPYFQKKRDEYQTMVSKALADGTYKSPEKQKKLREYKNQMITELAASNYAGTQVYKRPYDKIIETPELYDNPDEELKKINEYRDNYNPSNRPLNMEVKQMGDADFNKWLQGIAVPHKVGGGYTIKPDGTKEKWTGDTFDEKESMKLARNYSEDDTNKYSRGLRTHLRKTLAAVDPTYNQLPDRDKEALVEMAFKDYFVNAQRTKFTPKFNENISNAPSNLTEKTEKTEGNVTTVGKNIYVIGQGKGYGSGFDDAYKTYVDAATKAGQTPETREAFFKRNNVKETDYQIATKKKNKDTVTLIPWSDGTVGANPVVKKVGNKLMIQVEEPKAKTSIKTSKGYDSEIIYNPQEFVTKDIPFTKENYNKLVTHFPEIITQVKKANVMNGLPENFGIEEVTVVEPTKVSGKRTASSSKYKGVPSGGF